MISRKNIATHILYIMFLFTGFISEASASSSTATASAQARVVSPLVASPLRALQFGNIHPGTQGGVVSINPVNGARLFQGTAHHRFGRGHSASFRVTGERGRSYSIALPDRIYIKKRSGKGESLLVTNFHAFSRNTHQVGNVGTLNNRGRDKFFVGGDLFLTPSSLPGFYSARIDVVVSYQ